MINDENSLTQSLLPTKKKKPVKQSPSTHTSHHYREEQCIILRNAITMLIAIGVLVPVSIALFCIAGTMPDNRIYPVIGAFVLAILGVCSLIFPFRTILNTQKKLPKHVPWFPCTCPIFRKPAKDKGSASDDNAGYYLELQEME